MLRVQPLTGQRRLSRATWRERLAGAPTGADTGSLPYYGPVRHCAPKVQGSPVRQPRSRSLVAPNVPRGSGTLTGQLELERGALHRVLAEPS